MAIYCDFDLREPQPLVPKAADFALLGQAPSLIGGLGIGSLIGGLIQQHFSAKQRHREWVKDNKKAEWRELIDELDKSLVAMGYAFSTLNVVSASDPWNDPMTGIGKGNRIIHDRLFITDALKKHGVLAKWEELVRYTSDASNPPGPSQQGGPTPMGFSLKVNAFQDELLRVAQIDLGL